MMFIQVQSQCPYLHKCSYNAQQWYFTTRCIIMYVNCNFMMFPLSWYHTVLLYLHNEHLRPEALQRLTTSVAQDLDRHVTPGTHHRRSNNPIAGSPAQGSRRLVAVNNASLFQTPYGLDSALADFCKGSGSDDLADGYVVRIHFDLAGGAGGERVS